MKYGFMENGFEAKTYPILLQELFASWASSFGKVDTQPDAPLGQIATSLTLPHAQLWEQMLLSASNSDPRTSTGTYLRSQLSMLGITKKSATKATSTVYLGGVIGTTIASGSQVIQGTTKEKFDIKESVTISLNNLNKFEFKITDGFVVGAVIGFKINSVLVNRTVVTGDTKYSIYQSLISTIMANSVVYDVSSASISDDGSFITIESTIPYRSMVVESVIGGTIPKGWTRSYCESVNYGVIVVPIGSIDIIGTSITGWNNVTNPISGTSGSNDETDEEMKRRWVKAIQLGSNSTVPAIESKIWENVKNVSNVLVYTNRGDTTDIWGNPPHSVQITVEGGDENEIAELLARITPVGVAFSGNIVKSVLIDQSRLNVRFSRTRTLFGWIKVVIKAKNVEEQYPTNAEDLIRSACFSEAVRNVNLGADVIAQRFMGAIYKNVSGLENIEVTVAVTGRNTGVDPNSVVGDPINYNPLTYSSGYKNKVVVAPTDKVEWRDAFNSQRILIIDEVL